MNAIPTSNTTFTSEPTSIDRAVARQMHDRMHEGSIYILEGRAEMSFNPFTRHYQLEVADERQDDMALAASSRDGLHIALLGLVNYDREGWVERRPFAQVAAAEPDADTRAITYRFLSEEGANQFYAHSRRLQDTVSHPFRDAGGAWYVTQIQGRP